MKPAVAILAIASGLMLPPAAQAQFASVRLYGSLNLDFELVNGRQPDGSNPTVNRVSSNSSRFGIRGAEYLGRGQVAIFQLESTVLADTGGSTLASRETYLGLQGDWGTAKVGNFLTPYDDIHIIFGNAPTLSTSILSTAALWAQGALSKVHGGFDARLGNSLRYDSPTISGVTAEVQYSIRDASGTSGPENGDHASEQRHANVLSAAAFYSGAQFDLGVAYERNHKIRAETFNDEAWSIAGAYDFGVALPGFGPRVGFVYERLRYDTVTSELKRGDLKRDLYGVSATLPLGGGSIYAFWGRAGNGKGSADDGTQVGGLVKGPGTKCDQWELSYSYPLSPRTLLYAGYVKLNNDVNANYSFNINDYPTAPGGKPGGFVLGMVHFF